MSGRQLSSGVRSVFGGVLQPTTQTVEIEVDLCDNIDNMVSAHTHCSVCQGEIPLARREALPGTTTCVSCSTEEPKRGFMIWDHKTAPELEIDTPLARSGKGRWGYQPQLPFTQKEGKFGVAKSMVPAVELNSFMERERGRVVEPDVVPLERFPSKCHPARPRIGPSGLCLICAVEKQVLRLRRKVK